MPLSNITFEVRFTGGQGAVTVHGSDFGSKTFPDSLEFTIAQESGPHQVMVSGISPPAGNVYLNITQNDDILAHHVFSGQFHQIIAYEVNNTGPK